MIEYFSRKGSKNVVGKLPNYPEFSASVNKNSFLCIMLQNPTETDVERLCKDFKLDIAPFRKFKHESRSLRYNFNPLVFTFTDYYTTNNDIKISHLLFVVQNNLLILVTSDTADYYTELFTKVINKAKDKKKFSSGYILYEFLHQDAKENYDVLESLDDKIALLEDKILNNSHDKNIVAEIVGLKKEFIDMSKRLWASSKIIFTIRKDLTSIKLSKEDIALLDDIYDTFMHQIDLIETHKETVTDYLEIYSSTISNKLTATSNELNVVMKKMTAMTILIMVPTLIAGVYGMNFDFMPELSWPFGYAFALGAMVLAAYITYYQFHKKGWI
ncbi:MAG TPA: magnesium transporter CorA family protein [Alphaproteobacteria bacterium]|nr:magnesium transporter CorA family protein [Alphaproteobacteria bacterium]